MRSRPHRSEHPAGWGRADRGGGPGLPQGLCRPRLRAWWTGGRTARGLTLRIICFIRKSRAFQVFVESWLVTGENQPKDCGSQGKLVGWAEAEGQASHLILCNEKKNFSRVSTV